MTRKVRSTKRLKVLAGVLTLSLCIGFSANHLLGQIQDNQNEKLVLVNELSKSQEEIEDLNSQLQNVSSQNEELKVRIENLNREVSRGNARAIHVVVTAYDLSEASCNKGPSHPAYGLTASGVSLKGQTLESARAIAVDPNIIPLGSKVRIKFDEPSKQRYNGIYTAVDTGGAIKGNHIDLFFGDFNSSRPSREALEFGTRQATIVVL